MDNKVEQMRQSLQNALDYHNFSTVKVHVKLTQDKRSTKPRYFLQSGVESLSPILEYKDLNLFIMGMSRAKKIITK